MKNLKRTVIALTIVSALISCGVGSSKFPATADGFTAIEKDIKSEFGDAYFTDISVTYDKSVGNILNVTVTKDPLSLKMGQWNQIQGFWRQNSDISIEVPQGTKAEDYMYQLGKEISLTKLGELIE